MQILEKQINKDVKLVVEVSTSGAGSAYFRLKVSGHDPLRPDSIHTVDLSPEQARVIAMLVP